MGKSLERRIADAFPIDPRAPDTRRSDAIEYCKALRETWRDTSTSMNRTVLVAIAVAAVFYLSVHNVAEKMALFGFEFKDLTAAIVVLPVIFAYLCFELILLAMRYSDLSELHSLATEVAYPSVGANDLELWLAPPSRALLTLVYAKSENIASPAERVTNHVLTVIAYSIVVLSIAFEIYAYDVLFQRSVNTAWIWLSLVITVVLLAVGLTIVLMWLLEIYRSGRALIVFSKP